MSTNGSQSKSMEDLASDVKGALEDTSFIGDVLIQLKASEDAVGANDFIKQVLSGLDAILSGDEKDAKHTSSLVHTALCKLESIRSPNATKASKANAYIQTVLSLKQPDSMAVLKTACDDLGAFLQKVLPALVPAAFSDALSGNSFIGVTLSDAESSDESGDVAKAIDKNKSVGEVLSTWKKRIGDDSDDSHEDEAYALVLPSLEAPDTEEFSLETKQSSDIKSSKEWVTLKLGPPATAGSLGVYVGSSFFPFVDRDQNNALVLYGKVDKLKPPAGEQTLQVCKVLDDGQKGETVETYKFTCL